MVKTTRPKTPTRTKRRGEDAAPSMRPLVGARVYAVWLDMLRQLVPHGRTHRLSVFVASCLQYAAGQASEKWGTKAPPDGTAAQTLLYACESGPEEAESTVSRLAERLLHDAGVRFRRVNHRGQEYSIADDAASEFVR
jgi:hypothetical protein